MVECIINKVITSVFSLDAPASLYSMHQTILIIIPMEIQAV